MTTCACDLCAANRALWANPPSSPTRYDAASSLDEATLRRMHRQPSTADTYRRRFDQPTEPWQDETAVAAGAVRVAEVDAA